jgi:integrase
MVTVNLILDTRSKKKDGTHPVKLRIVHNRKTYHLSLGYSVTAKEWDDTAQKIKSNCKRFSNITRINALLHRDKQQALDLFARLQDEGRLDTLSFTEIKAMLANKETEVMTLAFGEEIIAQLRQAGKHGNARVYDTMLRSVRTFARDKDFPLKQISYRWLKKYEAWYLSRGNSLNGLGVSLRTLRALFNRAIKQKRIASDYYPFRDYQIKKESTRKRALKEDQLKALLQFESQTDRQQRAKDYFFISFYLMGASFSDLAFLRVSNIQHGRIVYKRRKTGRLHNILITPALQSLLDRYLEGKSGDDFILNVITAEEARKQVVQVRDELRRYNRTLKEIGALCGLATPLTSYVARHTYATIAKYKGVPTAVISEALGHSSEEVTQVYLDSFETEVLDQYHRIIIE